MVFYLRNKRYPVKYLLIWSVYAIAYTCASYLILPLPFTTLLTDSVIHATILSLLGFLLRNITHHNMAGYPFLIFFVVALWTGAGYVADTLFLGSSTANAILPAMGFRIITGIAISIIIIYYPGRRPEQKETPAPENSEPVIREPHQIERITVKTGNGTDIIPVNDILYIHSYGDYVCIVTEKRKFIKEQTMRYFEANLPNNQFIRIHRSYIANVSKISRIELHKKQNQQVTLVNGTELKVSASGYKFLRNYLMTTNS